MMAAVCLMAAMTFAAQCAATTKKGTQCKRQASPGSEYCWQHGGTTKAERGEGRSTPSPERKARSVESGETADEAPAARPVRRRRGEANGQDARSPSDAPAANDAPAPVEGQCQATTKRGTQCRRKAVEGGKYCAQHAAKMGGGEASGATAERPKRARRQKAEASAEPAADAKPERPKRARKPKTEAAAEPAAKPAEASGMCQGKTKSGEPCKRKAKPGSKFCHQHEK